MIKELFDLKPKKYGQYSDLEILPYLVKNNYVKCIVYGTGDMGKWFVDWLKKVYDIVPNYIVDEEPQYTGKNIMSLNELKSLKKEKYFVIVAEEKYTDLEYRKVLADKLKESGAVIIYDANRMSSPYLPSEYLYYKENVDEFEKLCDELCDHVSKETLSSYLKTYIIGDRYDGITFPEENKYWGKDDEKYSLFNIKDDEVVLNLGGCNGDTIFQYLKCGLPFKKIISVEADKKNCNYIIRSVDLLEESVRKKIQVDNYFIGEELTIDNLYGDENITLIEMDIEGAEMNALSTAKEVIKRNRPVLALCAYHKRDDLLRFTEFIKQNVDDYIFAIRKYPSEYFYYIAGIHQNNELVLYAIPKERYNIRI